MKNVLVISNSNQQGDRHVAASLSATLNPAGFAVAVLSGNAEQPLGVAACSFEINLDEPWQQILPGGDFAAYDGRPFEVPGNKWRINDVTGAALARKLNDRAATGQRLLFDYDHQTLFAKENGGKAPASAWGEKFEWRSGQGLFAQLAFTDTARTHIKANEYLYYSPVVMYDKVTGAVLDLHSAALTNDPAIKGMAEAAALHVQHQPEPKAMNEALALLFSLLGVTVDTNQEMDAAALHAALTTPEAATAIAALASQAENLETAQTAIATLKARQPGIPVATYNAVVAELAALKANHDAVTVDQVIEQAQKAGKFIATAELSYLKELGNADMAALNSLLDGRPVLAALTGKQTPEQDNPAKATAEKAALTADQKLIADQLGISHTEFAALHAAE